MSGSQYSMLYKGSIRLRTFTARAAFCALFLIAWIPLAFAQEPPLDVPLRRLSTKDPTATAVGDWLLYPTLRVYSVYSDNLFLSPTSPISVPGFGITPGLTAVRTDGIHTTTLFANIDRQVYPTDADINTIDGHAGFTQRYEALRDLIFTVNGNYTHQTLSSSLQNSIQTGIATPTAVPTPPPNGTPPGQPTGQPTGQTNPATGSNLPLIVSPSNSYTGAFSVEKIFNRGMLNLTGTVSRTDYENQSSQGTLQNTNSRTFSESAGFWLGPLFYAYSNGSIGTVVTDATSASTTSYRVIGGLGTRQFGLFRGSAYFGHQGSQSGGGGGGGGGAGGDVYGGSLSYYPTLRWTLTGTLDKTTNISSPGSVTNLALTLPTLAPVQIALGTSTHITNAGLQSTYEITPSWFASLQLNYTRIEYIASPRLDNAWVLDATLRYDIWHNMSLTWEYRYRSILSNAPFASAISNYGSMGATYKF